LSNLSIKETLVRLSLAGLDTLPVQVLKFFQTGMEDNFSCQTGVESWIEVMEEAQNFILALQLLWFMGI
jgi:2-iminoacetate synthase ThiH